MSWLTAMRLFFAGLAILCAVIAYAGASIPQRNRRRALPPPDDRCRRVSLEHEIAQFPKR